MTTARSPQRYRRALPTRLLALEDRSLPAALIGLLDGNALVAFDSTSPGTLDTTIPVTGLETGETLLGIDLRPATLQLYGLGSTGQLYTINTTSGAASKLGTPLTLTAGASYGFDFNPAADKLRIIGDDGKNFRIDPVTGVAIDDTVIDIAFDVTGVAYDRNFAGTAKTTLFGIDVAESQLVLIGGIDGDPSPNLGATTPVGKLGLAVTSVVGFDIAFDDNVAYAALTKTGDTIPQLVTIDLTTGAATIVGAIDTKGSITGLTAVPENNVPPAIKVAATATYQANGPDIVLSPAGTVIDPDSADFDGGTLTVTLATGGSTDDRLFLASPDVMLMGADVIVGGTTVGKFAGGVGDTDPLIISFNADSSPAAAQTVLRAVGYRSVNASPTTDARTVTFQLTDGDGGTSNLATTALTVIADTTQPTVDSLARGDKSPTNAAVVTYTVTFSEAVTGVDAGDFNVEIVNSPTLMDVVIDGVAGTGSDYTVTLKTGTGDGEFRINLVDNGTIVDLAGNALKTDGGIVSGPTYTIDRTAPTVTINQSTTQVDPTRALPVVFTVEFSEDVTGFDETGLVLGGSATPTKATVTGTGKSYTVEVTEVTSAGTITVSIAAGAASDEAGNTSDASTSDDNSVELLANAAPELVLIATQKIDEDTTLTLGGADAISVVDDAGDNPVEFTISVTNGVLSLNPMFADLTFSKGDGTDDASMTFQGTLKAINAALDGLVYEPNLNFNGTDTIAISVDDLGNSGFGGAKVTVGEVVVTIEAVNDAPVITVPPAQLTGQGLALTFSTANSNAISIADPDLGDGEISVALAANDGKLTLGSTADITITAGENDSGAVTFKGKLDAVNAALNGLTFAPDAAFLGAASITITADDLGNSGSGGAKTDSDTVTVTVEANNQAPVVTVVGGQTVDEDGELLFPLDPIVISDADAGDNEIEVALSVANGKLTINTLNLDGITFITGDGDGDASMRFTGKIAAINAALDAMLYVPNPDFAGSDAVTVVADDRGFTGFGGAKVTTNTIAITVNAVNDGPAINLPGGFIGTDPDTNLVFSTANKNAITITDVDIDDGMMTVQLTVTNGVVSLSATTGLTLLEGDGVDDAQVRFEGKLDAVNAALDGLVFAPANGFSGTASIAITADDNGNTGSGGNKVANATLNIEVATVNVGPTVTAPASVTTPEDTAFAFTGVSAVSVTDPDIGTGLMQITLATENGSLSLTELAGLEFSTGDGTNDASMTFKGTLTAVNAALATLTFNPAAEFSGSTTVVVTADDLGNTGAGGAKTDSETITVNVTAVNDAPTIVVPPEQTTGQNVGLVISTANGNAITVADPDAGDGILRVQIAVTNGVVTLAILDGLTFSTGDGTADAQMDFTGKLAAINAALDGLSFEPTNDFLGAASISLTVDDQGNTGDGGAKTGTGTVAVNVIANNQAPTITAPATVTADENTKFTFTGANAVSVADVDLGDGQIQITLAAANGVVSVTQSTGLTVTAGTIDPAGTTLTFKGTLADVNAALATLFFTPNTDFNGAASITITADDLGNTGFGGAKTSERIIGITVEGTNTGPSITLPTGQQVDENGTLVFSSTAGNAVTISDPDVGGGDMKVSLTVDFGTLTLATIDGLTFETGDGTGDASMTFTGTLADINAALDGLSFNPPTNFSGTVQFRVTADDQGNTGSGGAKTATEATTITVNAVNQGPVITAPATANVDENGTLTFSQANGNLISVSDADIGTEPLRVTLSVTNGTVSLSGTAGLTFEVGDGTNDQVMTFTGTVADVNTALSGLTYRPTTDFAGTSALTITADDQGGAGSGGAKTDTQTVTITVNALNNAPVVTVPGAQTVNQNQTLNFTASNNNVISISDIDVGTGDMKVTLSVTNGTLTLGSKNGLTFSAGDGDADTTMTFTGLLTNVNAALLTLSFAPTTDFSGNAVLTITADDQGNTGAGGAKTDTETVSIGVTDTDDNEPPVAVNDSFTAKAGQTLTISAPGVLTNDTTTSGKTLTAVLITGPTAAQGTVSLNADGSFTFTPADGFTGAATFTYKASDGALQSNTATVTITVTGDDTPSTSTRLIAAGAGPGGDPLVTVYNEDGTVRGSFLAFGKDFRGGVHVATGDLNGDGIDDILVGAGAGGGPHIKIFNGANLQEYFSIFAYDSIFNGGVRVAIGDVNNDGRNDMITAAGPGGGPHVKMFSGGDGAFISGYYSYNDRFAGGVFVASIDVNGDGLDDVVTGPGVGGGPQIRIFNGPSATVIREFAAFDEGFLGGVSVAAGFDSGRPTIYAGAGVGGAPIVRGFDATNGVAVLSFAAYASGFTGGVFVATEEIGGVIRIVTGPGQGGGPDLRVFNGDTLGQDRGVAAFDPAFLGGVFVG